MTPIRRAKACIAYVPFPRKRTAKKVARILIGEKFAACGNIFGPSVSLYRWNGKIESGREFILILKTTEAKYPKLEKRLAELHPYDCPCIAKISIGRLNADYLSWLLTSVK